MRKKRILFCSEATSLNTGYAGYTREILKYLYSTGKYEIAELGAYVTEDHQSEFPWRTYGVIPSEQRGEEARKHYLSSMSNQFGEYKFTEVCMDFLPDIVCDIRDFWMLEFQERSPFRDFFHWVIMPTVDAAPQANNWLMTYASAEACLTYSDWAADVLEKEGFTNCFGSAPPSAHRGLFPIENKESLRDEYKILKDKFVIGTVMRNQRRKLYPDLFEAFRKLLDSVEDPEKYILYCHTSFPDMGWDIPELLIQNNIVNNVVFTYMCDKTKKIFPNRFCGPVVVSPFAEDSAARLTNVKDGVDIPTFNTIYNLFDLYIQYANSEGFGLPQVEAAACGVPVMATDYSAMSSVIRKLGGTPLTPKALYKEMETGCMRAVPDNDETAKKIKEFFKKSEEERRDLGKQTYENFKKHYQWEQSGKKWEEIFDALPLRDMSETWFSPARVLQPQPKLQNYQQHALPDIVNHLVTHVLGLPQKKTSYMYQKLLRDLKYGHSYNANSNVYCNDSSMLEVSSSAKPFNYDTAYEICCSLRNQFNMAEQYRMQIISQKIN